MNLPRKRATPRRTEHPIQPSWSTGKRTPANAAPKPETPQVSPRRPRPKRSPEQIARRAAKSERQRDERMAFRDAVTAQTPGGFGDCVGTPGCAHLGPHRGDDPHHVAQKATHGSNDPTIGVFVCRFGHDWIHDHVGEATRLGLIERTGPSSA